MMLHITDDVAFKSTQFSATTLLIMCLRTNEWNVAYGGHTELAKASQPYFNMHEEFGAL